MYRKKRYFGSTRIIHPVFEYLRIASEIILILWGNLKPKSRGQGRFGHLRGLKLRNPWFQDDTG